MTLPKTLDLPDKSGWAGNEAAATASGVLMENGLHVQELAVRSEGLEAYFTALVGGDSHADAG